MAGDGWRAKVAALAAPVVASVEPRISAAAAWLFERRLHVLIISATAATIIMIGGAVALISFAGGGLQPDDEAANVLHAPRPTSTNTGDPGTYAPILPSPGPSPSHPPTAPTPTPSPDGGADEPVGDDPVDPTTVPEPVPDETRGNPNAPGQTKKPDKPGG